MVREHVYLLLCGHLWGGSLDCGKEKLSFVNPFVEWPGGYWWHGWQRKWNHDFIHVLPKKCLLLVYRWQENFCIPLWMCLSSTGNNCMTGTPTATWWRPLYLGIPVVAVHWNPPKQRTRGTDGNHSLDCQTAKHPQDEGRRGKKGNGWTLFKLSPHTWHDLTSSTRVAVPHGC